MCGDWGGREFSSLAMAGLTPLDSFLQSSYRNRCDFSQHSCQIVKALDVLTTQIRFKSLGLFFTQLNTGWEFNKHTGYFMTSPAD